MIKKRTKDDANEFNDIISKEETDINRKLIKKTF